MNELAPRLNFASGSEFIELKRRFHELSTYASEEDDIDVNHAFRIGDQLDWPALLNENRVVILSEAGSGKTAEIRNAALSLRAEGKPAFFIRPEHIPTNFDDAFEVGTHDEFLLWLTSGKEGWLLLDSVDESRLRNPADFELAIRKLGKRLSAVKDHTHIILSGRTTAWRPKTDLAICIKHLSYSPSSSIEQSQTINDTSSIEPSQTIHDVSDLPQDISIQQRQKPLLMFKIVSLDELNREQVAVFAKGRSIQHPQVFLEAIDRADAWSFTARPQDLEELVEFWVDNGRIGSRLDIMRNSIDRRLSERDQDRADAKPLAVDKARFGARLLAAATTLTRQQIIRVPDGANNANGLDMRSILPDWDDKDHATLLSRPIFDEAIYGAVRFHHRSVREYLAAEWFASLLSREVSRRNIEALFFGNQYGMDIVIPTLRPILPWLAIVDEKIRERVRKVAPEIIFEGGDPSQLPLEVRRYILHEVCEQMADGATGRSIRDYAAVQRFSNPDLAADVRTLIRKYAENDDLTSFLLRMVWLGEIKEVLPDALGIALSAMSGDYTRITAFRAVKAVGSAKDQELVRQQFLSEAPELPRDWLAELIDGLAPTSETLEWLLSALEKSSAKEAFSVDRLPDLIVDFAMRADISLLPKLVIGLNNLLSIPPVVERRYCEVSEKFQWLIQPSAAAVERLVLLQHPAALEAECLEILDKLSVVQAYGTDDMRKIKGEFEKIVPEWTQLNRALFWFKIRKARQSFENKGEGRLTEFWQASIFGSFTKFEVADLGYAADQINAQEFLDDKLVAVSLAFHLYKNAGRPREWRARLKKLVCQDSELSDRLSTYLKPPPADQINRGWKRMEAKWKQRDKADSTKQAAYHAEWKIEFNTNLNKIRDAQFGEPGSVRNPMLYLFKRCQSNRGNSNRWTEYNWRKLAPEYGQSTAEFYRDAVTKFWRHYKPKLRSEGESLTSTTTLTIIGLAGLEIESMENNGWP